MNKQIKLFGICIVFLLAVCIVNAQSVNEGNLTILLNSYSNYYSDGTFNADFIGFDNYPNNPQEAGSNRLNFSISGTGTSSTYTVVTTVYFSDQIGANSVTESKTTTGAVNVSILLDGNYYYCNDNTIKTDVRIYQNSDLKYENIFPVQLNCLTQPIYPEPESTSYIGGMNLDIDPQFEAVNITLGMFFPEPGNYTIGAFIGDNSTGTAYSETNVEVTGPFDQESAGLIAICSSPHYYCARKDVTIIFNASSLKEFKLNNEKLSLRSVRVNNHTLDYLDAVFFAIYDFEHPAPPLFSSSSSFDYGNIYITNYAFDKTHTSNGKLTELGVTLTATSINNPPYNVELSLENQVGEVIGTRQGIINSSSTPIWFNGTDIYNSKISGPYRVGYIKVTKNNQELIYSVDKGNSGDLSYSNFTSPAMPDLDIKDQDVILDGNNINVTIYNRGAGDAAGVTVSLFDNSANKVKEVILDKIPNGANTQYVFANAGLSNAFIAVDFSNEVEESNESNNIASTTTPAGTDPAKIISKQPNLNSLIMTDAQSTRFNVTANGTLPITYSWYLDSNLMSNSNNYTFAPTYYDEGPRTLKINVSNLNGSQAFTWNINVTPVNMSVYAYAYYRNARYENSSYVPLDANISFDGLIKNSSVAPAALRLSTNSLHNVIYNSSGYKGFATQLFFDSRLFMCLANQNCNLVNTFNTNCVWDSTNNDNWMCTVTNGPITDYFRMYTNPRRVKINAYLAN